MVKLSGSKGQCCPHCHESSSALIRSHGPIISLSVYYIDAHSGPSTGHFGMPVTVLLGLPPCFWFQVQCQSCCAVWISEN